MPQPVQLQQHGQRAFSGLFGALVLGTGTGSFGLLNVLKRHLSAQLLVTTEAEASALFTTKLLEDIVEVAAVQDDIGVVGAEGGLADLQGSLVVGAGAGQIAPGRLILQPVRPGIRR